MLCVLTFLECHIFTIIRNYTVCSGLVVTLSRIRFWFITTYKWTLTTNNPQSRLRCFFHAFKLTVCSHTWRCWLFIVDKGMAVMGILCFKTPPMVLTGTGCFNTTTSSIRVAWMNGLSAEMHSSLLVGDHVSVFASTKECVHGVLARPLAVGRVQHVLIEFEL